ncbi:glycosyltransferase family 2 protein [Natronoarchaeum sp. GCM10025703]|uniref:glycosyltransferase family 2 protein n=1 Tax=unclassified Natronoarchaeum TaxID=2620183 RepID=UPI00360C425B
MDPTVSVVLPTYNREDVISRAIDSVINQSFSDLELLVVDDNSSDNTSELMSQYGDKVNYICHDTNRGAPAARNTGIEAADGDFIAFIDSDDKWDCEKLERQVTRFRECSPQVGVVYTGYYVKHDGAVEIGEVPSKRGDLYKEQLKKDWINPTSTVMVRSSCFDKVDGFNEDLSARQDYELWIRISRDYDFDYIVDPLVTMYIENDNRITSNVEPRMEAHKQVLEYIQEDINSLPWHERRKSFAVQYFTVGRFLQSHRRFKDAISYYLKSIMLYPLLWKTYIALVLSLLRRDTKSKLVITIKNITRTT